MEWNGMVSYQSNITRKGIRSLLVVRRYLQRSSFEGTKFSAYITTCNDRPNLEYTTVLWDAKRQNLIIIDAIKAVRRRKARFVKGSHW